MDSAVSMYVFYSLIYSFFCLCLVAPPTEFVSAGITIQHIFSGYLGSEDMTFIEYHIKRGAVTAIVHSFIPLGYVVGLGLFAPEVSVWELAGGWLLTACIALPLGLAACVLFWQRDGWDRHPIANQLAQLSSGRGWRDVASAINIEFRRIDKFASGSFGRRLYVTDSWILKTSTYYVYIAHQNDIHLTLDKAEEHPLSYENSVATQYLNITVRRVEPHLKNFSIRLNALEYSDLKTKLQAQVLNARNIVVRQSLSDQFLDAFHSTVGENPVFPVRSDMELEPCIGCMQKESEVKLQRQCVSEEDNQAAAGETQCVQCFCRPMWCMDCMGKWFASRQDQQHPEGWLSGKAPCPTCRAIFCMLDVCAIVRQGG
ncbi:E3 ubiquitin-protein ligase TM129-like [Babylonia areolata]|uniref:E3 ubiquitin-protein ligase TM129-like n=1 Tax=Babylonia areolata TaxID=304850 RepID=UPI003FCFCF5E